MSRFTVIILIAVIMTAGFAATTIGSDFSTDLNLPDFKRKTPDTWQVAVAKAVAKEYNPAQAAANFWREKDFLANTGVIEPMPFNFKEYRADFHSYMDSLGYPVDSQNVRKWLATPYFNFGRNVEFYLNHPYSLKVAFRTAAMLDLPGFQENMKYFLGSYSGVIREAARLCVHPSDYNKNDVKSLTRYRGYEGGTQGLEIDRILLSASLSAVDPYGRKTSMRALKKWNRPTYDEVLGEKYGYDSSSRMYQMIQRAPMRLGMSSTQMNDHNIRYAFINKRWILNRSEWGYELRTGSYKNSGYYGLSVFGFYVLGDALYNGVFQTNVGAHLSLHALGSERIRTCEKFKLSLDPKVELTVHTGVRLWGIYFDPTIAVSGEFWFGPAEAVTRYTNDDMVGPPAKLFADASVSVSLGF